MQPLPQSASSATDNPYNSESASSDSSSLKHILQSRSRVKNVISEPNPIWEERGPCRAQTNLSSTRTPTALVTYPDHPLSRLVTYPDHPLNRNRGYTHGDNERNATYSLENDLI